MQGSRRGNSCRFAFNQAVFGALRRAASAAIFSAVGIFTIPTGVSKEKKKIQNFLLKFSNYFVVDFTILYMIYYRRIGGIA